MKRNRYNNEDWLHDYYHQDETEESTHTRGMLTYFIIFWLVFLLILAIIIGYSYKYLNTEKDVSNSSTSNTYFVIKGQLPTLKVFGSKSDSIKAYIALKASTPKVVIAQSKLESNHGRSYLGREYNNLFGMKLPRVRETLATGATSSGFAVYPHWKDSVKDYVLYQDRFLNPKCLLIHTENYYLSKIADIGYAEDPKYLNKLATLVEEM